MYRIENSDLLYLTAIIPFLLLLFIVIRVIRKKLLKKFAEEGLISKIMPVVSNTRPALKFVLLMFASVFIIIGLANPQIGSKMEEIKRKGADIMIALDVSNSMLAEDIKPNRLERAKQAISKTIDMLGGDRLGLVVFGGQAYVQLPITTDFAAAKMFLSTVSTDIIPTQGTAIGEAIETCIKSFSGNEKDQKESVNKRNKAIIIITDGENHEDDAIGAASEAAKAGIVVHTIGMGNPQGSPIPVYSGGKNAGFRKDGSGNTIVTKLNEQMLQQIAAAGGGTYIRANNVNVGLNILFDKLNELEKVELGSKVFTDYEDRYQFFLAPAIILLLLELFISERKSRWMRKLKLFRRV